jgi:hypothetical protein
MTTITLHATLLVCSNCIGLNPDPFGATSFDRLRTLSLSKCRANSTRDQGEVLFSERTLMGEQKAFLECPVKKLPFHEVLKTIPKVMFR